MVLHFAPEGSVVASGYLTLMVGLKPAPLPFFGTALI